MGRIQPPTSYATDENNSAAVCKHYSSLQQTGHAMEWNGRRFFRIPYCKISSIPYPFHTKNFPFYIPFHTKFFFHIPFHSSKLMYSDLARNFKRVGHNFHLFFKRFYFFGGTNLKLIEKQEKLLGDPGACFPGNFLKIYML